MDSVRLKPIAFCGENPVMELFDSTTKNISAAASFWHCTYSSYGEGNVLLIYFDAANASTLEQPTVAIYTDNAPLARYLTDTFNQHFDGWKDFGFKDVPVQQARFVREADPRRFYRVACHTETLIVDVLWMDIRSSDFRTFPDLNGGGFGAAGDEHYHVSNAIFLCEQGAISVNKREAAGASQTLTTPEGRFASSVFIALSETWVKMEQPSIS